MYVNLECAVACSQSDSSWTRHGRNSGTVHLEVAAHLPQLSHEEMVETHANHLVVIDSGMAETSGSRSQAGMTNEAARALLLLSIITGEFIPDLSRAARVLHILVISADSSSPSPPSSSIHLDPPNLIQSHYS